MAPRESFMKQNKNKIERYLNAVTFAFENDLTPGEYWPLKPAQMTAYFEDSLAVDVFEKVEVLRRQKVSIDNVAKMFSTPGILRNFLENFANTGLKTAHNVGWFKTSFKEREDSFKYLFRVLGKMVRSDIFIQDGRQIILSRRDLEKIPWNKFIKINKQIRKIIKKFDLALFGLVWSLFFDVFTYTGFSLHGPYRVSVKKFGKNKILVVNDYFNLRPVEIWHKAKNVPFEKVRIYHIYKNIDWKINFFERIDPKLDLTNNLCFAMIEINGKQTNNLEKIENLTEYIFKITQKQTDFVNNLTSLEIVRKSSEICYYGLRNLFAYFREDWMPPRTIDWVIEKFNDKLVKKYNRDLADYPPVKIRKLFDPRNNWY